MQYFYVAAFMLAVYKVFLFIKGYVRIRHGLRSVPLAPGCSPLIGHVIPLVTAPSRGYGAWDQLEKWLDAAGKIVKVRILADQAVVVSDPKALKRILQTGYKLYLKDLEMSYSPFLPILGTGLVTSEGDLWQRQRTLIGPALRVEILDDIVGIAKSAADRLSIKLARFRGTGLSIDVEVEFRTLTLQVIGDAILSMPPEECDRVFPHLYLPIMVEGHRRVLRPWRKFIPGPEWFRQKRRVAMLNSFLIDLVRQRWSQRSRKRNGRQDILDRILDSLETNGIKWSSALEVQLCYEIKTFLLAGHETSASMLTWAVYELSQSEDYRKEVLREAQVAFGDSDSTPPRSAVDSMSFTVSVLRETLRLHNPVPAVTRRNAVDDALVGHPIPAGTLIIVSLRHAHMEGWRDPETFRPNRFMPGDEYDQFPDDVRPYKFVPFIQGPRNCLGQHFALLEARVVLSLLTKRFVFKPVRPDAGMTEETVIPVSPKFGMEVTVE